MKINENLDISVKNYLGQLEKGVVVLLSIKHNDKMYEATYWYDNEYKVVTLEESLEKEIGDITKLSEYEELVDYLDKNTSNFDEIYQKLQPIQI